MLKFLVLSILSFNLFAAETLDEVQVTGNKEGRTYSETPESVTILPASRINRGDQNNSLEVLNGQANIQVSRNAETFSIRGVNNTGVTGYQKDNLASIFVDDVFQTDLALRAGAFEVWDLQSLEVYRGPQSTSQGVNSLAGAILLNHHGAQQGSEAAIKAGYGTFNRRELGGLINKSFLNNKLAVRFTFNKDMNDGFITNRTTKNDKWGRQDKDYLSLDAKYFFDDKSELGFNSKLLKTNNGGNYTIGGKYYNHNVYEDRDYQTVTNNQQNSVYYLKPLNSSFSNKTTLAYSGSHQNNKFDGDATPQPTAGVRYEYANDQFISLENVLKYNSSKVKNALGVHAHEFRGFNSYDFTGLTNGFAARLNQDLDKFRETFAIFDSLLYKFDDHHALNLGARYEHVSNQYGTYVNPVTLTGNATIDAALNNSKGSYDGTQSTNKFLPKVGYIYQNREHTWGITYSEGYRIGGLDINRNKARAVKYDPETTKNYELSWKYITDRFKTQANIFYTHWSDQQVEVRLSNALYDTQVQNASTSELYGGELESTYSLKNGDLVRMGVGHVHTQFLGFHNNGTVYTGNQFPDAAKWTAQTAYSHFFTDAINGNLTLRHLSKSYTNAENTRKSPDQFYVDLNFQYTGSNYVWELNAKNLLGQEYVLNSTQVYQNNYKRLNRPREFNTRVTWFW